MATISFIVLALCACALAFPYEPTNPPTRNTIFGDEKLIGEIFEDLRPDDAGILRTDDPSAAYRLPTTTRPRHYNILWTINMAQLTFSGTVNIELYATEAGVSEITMHARDLDISRLVLNQGTTSVATTFNIEQTDTHFLNIRLTSGSLLYDAASPVIYTLSIDFSAPLRTDMYGIYQSWFRNQYTDEVSYMASTQFQATAARAAFPCYDEPSFKATFDITIRRPDDYFSWCLTRLRRRENNLMGYTDDIYNTTPVMSTYLIALIVAQYESLNLMQEGELVYEVIARPAAIQSGQGQYAYDVGLELLAEMSAHTALDFYQVHPTIKMTQAAIPDFGAGAMENWGLLTYREAYLMYDPQHTNGYFQQLIAYILSHEIAHMWFGNLVTCDWWDVLWLNEGFARYYQYFLTHWVEDHMGFETRFIIEQVHASLLSDSANNPHALSTTGIGSPSAVSGMFSTISYNKGAAVIRMTEHLLGFENHRQGLINYLVDYSFTTALPINLFNSLQNVSIVTGAIEQYGPEFSVVDYYRSWTEQPGHPVLNVQVNHQTGEMIIYQRRFNINTGYAASSSNNYIIPITFATASNPDFADTKPSHIISQSVTSINRSTIGDEWVIFNKQQTGFYRVNYDDYTWDLIVIALRGSQRTQIHEYNRAQIVNDVFQFARSGLMTYTRAFNILSFLENETDYAPWVAATTGFTWIRNRLAGTSYLDQLNRQIARWAETAIDQLTYEPLPNESFMQSYLRYQLAPVLCNVGVDACRNSAVQQFNNLVNNGVEVPVDSRNWVYCNALRQGGATAFNYLWTRFIQHNVYTEKIQLLMVLGCTPDQPSLYTFLDNIVQNNYVIRPQDYTTAFNSAVTGNEGNTQIVFSYVQANLQAVINAFGSAATPLSYISARLRTEAEVIAFQTWADNNREALGTSYQSVYNGAEASRQSIQWAAENEADFVNYFTTGDDNLQFSTPRTEPVVDPVTVMPPSLVEPTTPDLPSSATTTCVSVVLATLAFVANFMV